MPDIRTNRAAAAFHLVVDFPEARDRRLAGAGRAAAVPVRAGQRSNPAVLGDTLFPELDVDAWEDLHLLHGIRST
jgi:hypothetical protein